MKYLLAVLLLIPSIAFAQTYKDGQVTVPLDQYAQPILDQINASQATVAKASADIQDLTRQTNERMQIIADQNAKIEAMQAQLNDLLGIKPAPMVAESVTVISEQTTTE